MQRRNSEDLHIVIDTNVIISFFWGGATIMKIVDDLARGVYQSVVSPAMLTELRSIGSREKFRKKFSFEVFEELFRTYQDISLLVYPRRKVIGSRDTSDNMFLECALEIEADYLISGDNHLLELKAFHGIQIVTPAQFVKAKKGRIQKDIV